MKSSVKEKRYLVLFPNKKAAGFFMNTCDLTLPKESLVSGPALIAEQAGIHLTEAQKSKLEVDDDKTKTMPTLLLKTESSDTPNPSPIRRRRASF